MSIDRVVVDLSDGFAAGQAYVALSRCTSLQGLQIKCAPPSPRAAP